MRKLRHIRPAALMALGVFLGRGAQADTTLDFDAYNPPPAGQGLGAEVIQSFGDYAAASSEGVTVTGFGTPNIGLTWGGIGAADTRWDYYNDTGVYDVWSAGQLNRSRVGDSHEIVFAPNSATARAIIKSFNFHPYYNDPTESYDYSWEVRAGITVLQSGSLSFLADATKNHPVSINHTGSLGQTLTLRLTRTGGTDGTGHGSASSQNIAVDDIKFGQLPEALQPTGPQVVAVTPANLQTGIAAISSPYEATIADGATTVAAPIQLKLDGTLVSPPPTVTPLGGGQTTVSYPGISFLTSGSHTYTLTYADNLGAFYTNEVQFSSIYTTLPATYALPPGSGVVGGFKLRSVSASLEVTTSLPNSIARAKAQLAGTLINPDSTLPYTNGASLGSNPDGSFNVDGAFNFVDSGGVGNFPDDVPFPGLDAGPYDWYSDEAVLHLNLAAGYYRFGVNSDDGFEVSATPPQGVSGSPLVLGLFDGGRGPADTLFDVQVQTSGIYPFRVIHFEGNQGSGCEFFSVTNLVTGDKALINDANPNSIKSFRVLKPQVTSIVKSGANALVNWAYGAPPFQVQVKTNLTDANWSNVGAPTAGNSASVPIDSNTKFIRVGYSQP